ncbi:hypothetical protein DF186_25375 [Enterococcus hirae]|nr:hypothetical protein DF186_25375 [Enterococcus hirae]
MLGIGDCVVKKIFVFGGDGFCGWLIVLYLFELGYEVVIIDNFLCSWIDGCGCSSMEGGDGMGRLLCG